MTQTTHSQADQLAGDTAADLSPLAAGRALGAILLLAAALLGKQIAFARIATADATGFYLPMARAWVDGRDEQAQHVAVPPLYPMAIGACSGAFAWADDPYELAGRSLSAISAMALVWIVYALGVQMGSRRAGVVAAGLTAANRAVIRIGAAVGPDMVYAALLAGLALMLLKYRRRGRIVLAVAIGAIGASAALFRGEGFLLVGFAAVAIAAAPLHSGRRWWRGRGLPTLLMLAVAVAVWSPRLVYMKGKTGWPILDIRLIPLVTRDPAVHRSVGLDEHTWLPLRQVIAPPGPSEQAATAPAAPKPPKSLGRRLGEATESLTDVIGYLSWPLIVFWLVAGRRDLGRRGGHLLLFLLLLMELGVLGAVTLGKRYVTIVTGPAQVWAGLGAAALAERLRRRAPSPEAAATAARRMLAGFVVMLAVLSAVSLFSRNHGTRHAELRSLGRLARERFGPGQLILAQRPELAYYADGYYVAAPDPRIGPDADREVLAHLCRTYALRLIELQAARPCSRWLLEQVRSSRLPAGALALVAERSCGKTTTYLIDARKLFPPAAPATKPSARSDLDWLLTPG